MFDEPDNDGMDGAENDRQLMVHAGFEDADDQDSENQAEEDDHDSATSGEKMINLEARNADEKRNAGVTDEGNRNTSPQGLVAPLRSSRRRSRRLAVSQNGLGIEDSEVINMMDENGRPYPSSYNNPLLEMYSQEDVEMPEKSLGKRKRQNRKLSGPSRVSSTTAAIGSYPVRELINRRESSASLKSVRFEDGAEPTPPTTILGVEEDDDTDDGDFEMPDDVDGEVDESDKENAEPKSGEESSNQVRASRHMYK